MYIIYINTKNQMQTSMPSVLYNTLVFVPFQRLPLGTIPVFSHTNVVLIEPICVECFPHNHLSALCCMMFTIVPGDD